MKIEVVSNAVQHANPHLQLAREKINLSDKKTLQSFLPVASRKLTCQTCGIFTYLVIVSQPRP